MRDDHESAWPDENRRRSPRLSLLSLFLIGLLLGLSGALVYTWLIDPVTYVNASPAQLSPVSQSDYLYMISQSMAVDGDWTRAENRLLDLTEAELSGDERLSIVKEMVSAELDRYLRQGRPPQQVESMANLAQQLGVDNAAVTVLFPTPGQVATRPPTATPQPTTTPSQTPLPTATATPPLTATPSPPPTITPTMPPLPTVSQLYQLIDQQRICRSDAIVDRLEVLVVNVNDTAQAGVEIIVRWNGGEDHFFTGFVAGESAGYGDFTMEQETAYAVSVAAGSPVVPDVGIVPCPPEEGGQLGGWRITFRQSEAATSLPDE